MKKFICFAITLLVLTLAPVFGQQTPAKTGSTPTLTKFNLDFPGGTPGELVKAIEKATGKPLNVIIPEEDANFKLPPLKLHEVTFRQVAETIGNSKTIWVLSKSGIRLPIQTGYQFTTPNNPPTDNSIWFFHVQQPPPKSPTQKVCQFYNLDPFLNRGFTVDDITTAIQTGWKMAGITSLPKLEYHKETKLLIAYGEPDQLGIIQQVLSTLPESRVTRNDIADLQHRMHQLEMQVDKLKKELAALNSSPSPPSEEKSGK